MMRTLLALFLLAQVARLAAQDYTFSNVASTSTDRRTTAGQWGARFHNTSGEIITITHVGRWIFSGNSGTHLITVYGDYGEFLGSATVDCSGTPGTWAWAALSVPAQVSVGYRAWIFSTEGNGDQWSNPFGGTGYSATDSDIGYFQTARNIGTPEVPIGQEDGGLFMSYGPVNFRYSSPVQTWTKAGTVYTTDGTQYQVSSAIADATIGDTIMLPAGTVTWGVGGAGISINKAVTVQGAGIDQTIINQSATASAGWGSTFISLASGATIRKLTITGADIEGGVFSTGAATDWRISEVKYVQYPNRNPYFVYAQYSPRGLIDQCDITGGKGNSELVFARGPSDAWNVATPVGTENNIFIEDSIFRGAGYVCDANSNGRIVVRNCTITDGIKVDSHGVWSNGGPQRGARNLEVYRNTWTLTTGAWPAIEIRGGTGMVWGNSSAATNASNMAWFFLTEYGLFNNNGAFHPNFQTAFDYPIRDQIGRGQYSTADDWTTAASEPIYVWDNLKGGLQWPLSYKTIAAGAITRFRDQTGNPTATFVWEDVIQADRDYFRDVAGFNGSTGVGTGTAAAMAAITPTKTGVGFWVTDEGTWDLSNGATTDGRLYRWNDSAWVLHYTPYAYPHPMRSGDAPSVITPTFTPSAPTHSTPQSVSITGETASATYYYTLDGTTPTAASTLYTDPVSIGYGTTTMKSIGVKAAHENSAVRSVTYVITAAPGAPSFSLHPTTQSATVGDNVTLTVAASGDPTFQWRKGGVNISDATSASLALTNVQLADAGSYDSVATNAGGSATSNAGVLTVNHGGNGGDGGTINVGTINVGTLSLP